MPEIICDRTDCIYCYKYECMRTSIKISSDPSYAGAYCESVEIKDAEKRE